MIYVDEPSTTYRRNGWCHMMTDQTDDLQELHNMAAALGLRRDYFQDHILHPHYDLSPGKRKMAVRLGAVEVTRKEIVEKCSRYFQR